MSPLGSGGQNKTELNLLFARPHVLSAARVSSEVNCYPNQTFAFLGNVGAIGMAGTIGLSRGFRQRILPVE
jgi:hypothetical protein